MRQRNYGRDLELTFRMGITMMMLAVVYVFFLGLLMMAGLPWELVLIIAVAMAFFQYFMSDKLVLATTGAREVTAEEEPRLHGIIERLVAIADMPKPKKIAVNGDARAQRVRYRAKPEELGHSRYERASESAQRARAGSGAGS